MSENHQGQEQKEVKTGKNNKKLDSLKRLECRICLSKIESNEMMDVCQCKGSSGALHKHCLVEWIKQSKKYYRNGLKYYFDCEVCKYPMEIESSLRVRCCESTNKCNLQYILFNILMIFLMVVSILLIILPNVGVVDESDTTLRNALLVIGIVTLVIEILLEIIYHLVIISPGVVGVRKVNLELFNSNAKETPNQETEQTNPSTVQQIHTINDEL